jgi:hypothetical protein
MASDKTVFPEAHFHFDKTFAEAHFHFDKAFAEALLRIQFLCC